jgi:hypothetical protein
MCITHTTGVGGTGVGGTGVGGTGVGGTGVGGTGYTSNRVFPLNHESSNELCYLQLAGQVSAINIKRIQFRFDKKKKKKSDYSNQTHSPMAPDSAQKNNRDDEQRRKTCQCFRTSNRHPTAASDHIGRCHSWTSNLRSATETALSYLYQCHFHFQNSNTKAFLEKNTTPTVSIGSSPYTIGTWRASTAGRQANVGVERTVQQVVKVIGDTIAVWQLKASVW